MKVLGVSRVLVVAALLLAPVSLLLGCKPAQRDGRGRGGLAASSSAAPGSGSTAQVAFTTGGGVCGAQEAQGPAAAPTDCAAAQPPQPTCGGEAKAEGCGLCGGGAPTVDDVARVFKDPVTGVEGQAVGAALGAAKLLTVPELLAQAGNLKGQTVRLSGQVSAMCQHRRAWMALQQPEDRSGGWVRVLAAPRFLIPAGSVGKKAIAEGTVEVVEVPAAGTRHLAQEHSLSQGAQQQVVVRATGAVLTP
jgi:hypothetical protein